MFFAEGARYQFCAEPLLFDLVIDDCHHGHTCLGASRIAQRPRVVKAVQVVSLVCRRNRTRRTSSSTTHWMRCCRGCTVPAAASVSVALNVGCRRFTQGLEVAFGRSPTVTRFVFARFVSEGCEARFVIEISCLAGRSPSGPTCISVLK